MRIFDSFIDSLDFGVRFDFFRKKKASKPRRDLPRAQNQDAIRSSEESESSPPPGFFTNASHFIVQGSELNNNIKNDYNNIINNYNNNVNNNYNNVNNYTMFISGNTVLQHLVPYTDPDAAVDSSARWPPPSCHPGTRRTICTKLMSWLYDVTREWKFIWLWGSAGCGKSAVAQTFAEKCLELGFLGASFFFSRPNHRNDPKKVVPTLIYQLATHCPAYKAIITSRLSDDPQLLAKTIPVQFKKLIIEPFSELQQRGLVNAQQPFVIILDGLDECQSELAQCEIVKQIEEAVRLKKGLPLIWMVCSRPEAHLQHTFARIPVCSPEELTIDDECRDDVDRYLSAGFFDLQVKYNIDSAWPPAEKFTALSKGGLGHFVFAATALGFIGDEEYGNPVQRLDELVAFLEDAEHDGVTNPLAKLDFLYTCILAEIPRDIFPTTWRILAHFIFARNIDYSLSAFIYESAQALCNFVNVNQSTFYGALWKLYSVVAVPRPEKAATTPLRFYHASFQDYLVDANRSGRFAVKEKQALVDITKSLFHWHQVDAMHFHTQENVYKIVQPLALGGPREGRSHNHAALPGLKWIANIDVQSLSNDISEFGTGGSWAGCAEVGPDPDLLCCVFRLDMRHLYIDIHPWCKFLVGCYRKGLLGDFCRTEPSEEFDTVLIDRLKMMTNQEPVKPASFPLVWSGETLYAFREYILMGYGSKSVIVWQTEHGRASYRLDCLTCDQEPSLSQISEYQEWLQKAGCLSSNLRIKLVTNESVKATFEAVFSSEDGSNSNFRSSGAHRTPLKPALNFDEDGVPIRGDECPFRRSECWFAHPEDVEWADARAKRGRRPPPDRRGSFSSRGYGGGRDRSRDRSQDRGRAYSPRDRGWGERQERRNSRSRERRQDSARVNREDSVASSREDPASPPSQRIVRTLSGKIPTEPSAFRKATATSIDIPTAKPVTATSSKGINIDVVNPKPPSVTPSPVPPPPTTTPPPVVEPLGSPAVLTSQQKSRKQSTGSFVVPALPPSAAKVPTETSNTSTSRPAPTTTVSSTTPITPSSASFASIPPTAVPPPSAVDSASERIITDQESHQPPRTPVIIKAPAPKLRISETPGTGATTTTMDISSSSPAAAAAPATPAVITSSSAATGATATNMVAQEQPEVEDVEMASPPEQSTSIFGLTGEVLMVQAQALSQLQDSKSEVSQLPQQLSLPPPLPPMPSFDVMETTVDELSHEAKIELWNKRIKTISELLVHHEQIIKLNSDIEDLKRYASSSYFSSSPTSTTNPSFPASTTSTSTSTAPTSIQPSAPTTNEEEKSRIETNLSSLHSARDTAKQSIRELLEGLIAADTWPTVPAIEDIRKKNERVGEYVRELDGNMKKVRGDLEELVGLGRELKKGRGGGRKKRKGKEREVGEGEKVKEDANEKEKGVMEVDAEVSTAATSETAPQPQTSNQTQPQTSPAAVATTDAPPETETDTNVDAESSSSETETTSKSTLQTQRIYQKLNSRLSRLQTEVATLHNVLTETESNWIQETQELYQSLLQKHHSSLSKHRSSLTSTLTNQTTTLEATLTELSTTSTATSTKLAELTSEQTQLLSQIAKLKEEKTRLEENQKAFVEKEVPEIKRMFEGYKEERDRDRKRVGALEAALSAFGRRPPVPLDINGSSSSLVEAAVMPSVINSPPRASKADGRKCEEDSGRDG
ncbi:hypothetical protein NP233_g5910 [Leucocoprinus birnbaumii]|uniref:Nephrocystin 3-like N-terminal domain-containing protein n=1 Tax=Leucocoprinus birnbaumii TaxID=56174 RepID=A0AAD5VRZ1_9AGAR|nr:hypothetical protein NP233_g5910 [Leucocoprinus birnbaumii]